MLTNLLLFLTLLLPVARAEALPALFFDGGIHYTQATGEVTVDGDIALTDDLPLPATLSGGRFHLAAQLASITPGPVIIATLDPTPGGPGVSVVADDGTSLLLGDLTTAELAGAEGWDLGRLIGDITPTGGTVAQSFTDPSSLFALSLGLTTPFTVQMFEADFTGRVSGRIQALADPLPLDVAPIPEPATAILFFAGLPLLIFATRLRGMNMLLLRTLLLGLLLVPAGRAGANVAYPRLLFGDFGSDTGFTYTYAVETPWVASGIAIDASAYRIDFADFSTQNLTPNLPFSLTADLAGSGTLTVGDPASPALTATVSNGAILSSGLTLLLYTADLTYTGGAYASGLSSGTLAASLADYRSTGGIIHAGGELGAIAASPPGGDSIVGAATVPEPTSLLLLGSAAALLLARRRMHR